jgi:hypothetical protein
LEKKGIIATSTASAEVRMDEFSMSNIRKQSKFYVPEDATDYDLENALKKYFLSCLVALQKEFPISYVPSYRIARNVVAVSEEKQNEANRKKVEQLRKHIPLPLELINGKVCKVH